MTFKVKEGVQVGSTLALDANGKLTTGLSTGRSISLSGDIVGSATFDGTSNITIATTVQANSVALGTDTTGNYMVNVAAGTGVSVSHTQGEGSTATVSIGQAVGTTDNVTFNNVTVNGTLTSDDITSTNISVAGNATITGNLTVSGTTTTVNSTTIALADANLELARNATTAAQANGAGITVTGPTTPATLTYSSSDDRWNLNKDLNINRVYGNLTGAVTGNASTASTLQTTRSITATGDASWTVNFDGSTNVSGALTLANSGVTAGSYGSGTAIPVLTIDSKGRVTSASTAGVVIGDGILTVSAGAGLTGSGTFTANQTTNNTITISHADTSSVANLSSDNTGNTFIQDLSLTFDTYGHVTGATVATGTVSVGDGAMTVTAGAGLTGGGQVGTANQTGASSVTISHADTSSVANQSAATNTFISGITFDTYGHVQTITTGSPSGFLTTSGKAADSELLDGQDSTGFLRLLSSGAEASIDSYTDNGFRAVSYTGHSKHMLSWNAGGSTGTVQQEFHYNTPSNGWRIRNKTDNTTWSAWGNVVMASANQGLISGTIWHSGNLTNLNQLANGPGYITGESDTLATVTARGASTSTTVSLNGGAALGDGFVYFNDTNRDPSAAVYYPQAQTRAVRFIFANASSTGTGGNYAGVMHFSPWTGTTASTGDASYQLAFGSTAANNGGTPQLRIRKGIDTTWNAWYDILTSANYNSYSPTLTGTGASGTWGISISGNAATASSVAWTNVSSRPTAVSSFTNDSGYITGSYLDDYTRGAYRVIADYAGTSTWYIRSNGRFTWARAHDWTQTFELNIANGTAASNNGWAELGQNTSNNAAGTWFGTRFVQYTGSAKIDGYIRAGRYYLGDDTNYITSGGAGAIRSQTSTGYVDVGSMHSSWAHLQTDRPSFYFNKSVYVDGDLYKYTGSLPYLHSGNYTSYTMARDNWNGNLYFNNDGRIYSTIMYDANDSGYYTNANSTSSFNVLNSNTINVQNGYSCVAQGYNNNGGFAMNNSGTYWGLMWNYASNDWRIGWGSTTAQNGWGMRWDSSGNAWSNASHRAPIFYDNNDTGYYVDPNSYSRMRQLTLTQARVDSSKYPVGHYTSGIEVFSIDPTWTQDQLREYFNTSNVSWVADSTAPGGYAIQVTGNTSVGGNSYGSGFPFIPVDTDDTFYMECWIKDVSGTNGHFMGSIDFNESFGNLGGNPGSYGYWVMANTYPGASWTRVTGYISGFGTSTGTFKSGTKYWTPQALFNYSGGGTSYISGWKVYRLARGIVGRFPNSTTNSGEAWYGRANDRNRGTYTIQLGGGSSSGRSFEVVDYAWSSVMFSVDSGNYATAAGSFRAPLFYDLDNTAYYCDPASTSVFNQINLNTAGTAKMLWRAAGSGTPGIGAPFYWNSATGSIVIEVSDNDTGGVVIDNEGVTVFGAGDTGGVFRVIDEDSYQSLANVTSATCFQVNQNAGGGGYIRGDFTATGNLIAQSDIRLKYDIEDVTGALDKVKAIRGVTFRMKDAITNKRSVGVIAQEVELVLPEAVRENEEGIKSVAYGNMVGLLIEAIKEQQSEIDELKSLVKQLLAK